MRRLNVKLLGILVVTLLVTIVGVHVLHGRQILKQTGMLLKEAQKAEEEGELRDAVKKYGQYLQRHREDLETQKKMANLAADISEKPDATIGDMRNAYRILQAAAEHKELVDIRRRLAKFLMRLGRWSDALTEWSALRDIDNNDPEINIQYARCKVLVGEETDAIGDLSKLIGYNKELSTFNAEDTEKATSPDNVDAYLLLANILARGSDTKRADAVMQQLVAANPDLAKAHFEYARHCFRMGRSEKAKEELAKALKLAPDDPDVLTFMADVAISEKDFDRAETLLKKGLKEHPDYVGVYIGLARVASAQKKFAEATEHVRAGLKEVPKNQVLLAFLSDLQVQDSDLDGLRSTIAEMRDAKLPKEIVDYNEARLAVGEQKWLEASKKLEKLRSAAAKSPELVLQVDMLLGLCYEKLRQFDQAVDAYDRVLISNPSYREAKLAHSKALAQTGQRDKANDEVRELAKTFKNQDVLSKRVQGSVIQIKVSDELQKPAAERNWQEVDVLMEEMLGSDALTDLQKGLLKVEILMAKEDLKQAEKALAGMIKKYPKELVVWLDGINLIQRQSAQEIAAKGKLSEEQQRKVIQASATKLLNFIGRAEKSAGSQSALRTARAAALTRLDAEQAKKGLAELEKQINALPVEEQILLWSAIGNAYYRLRDYDNIRRCWKNAVDKRPNEPRLQQSLFDVAQEFDDEKGMQEATDEIGKQAGTDSPFYKYCLVSRMIWEVRKGKTKKSQLAEASKLIEEAERRRGSWYELYRLAGEIDELENKPDSAIKNFQRALELGDPRSITARRLVLLLFRTGRNAEVEGAMKYVGPLAVSDPLNKVRIGAMDNKQEALDLAKQAVDEEPNKAANHLWYGQLLADAKRKDDAETEFRTATEKDPTLVQAWLMLVNHLNANLKKNQAQDAIVKAKDALPENQVTSFLAQAYETVGNRNLAEQYYQSDLEEHPNDLAVLRPMAAFYVRNNKYQKARETIERMLALKAPANDEAAASNLAWANRALAEVLARTGDHQEVQRAVKLIESTSPDGRLAPEDILMLAGILSGRPDGASRDRAIELLEKLQSRRKLNSKEQMVLAGLYDRSDNWSKARDQLASLALDNDKNPQVLITYIQLLLKHNEVKSAGLWIRKLEDLQSKHPVTIQLKARWLDKDGKTDEAAKYVKSWIPKQPKPEQASSLLGLALLLEELEQYPAAEKLYRKCYELEPKAILALAGFLGRHGNLDEAFQLFDEARGSESSAMVLPTVLQVLHARPEDISKQQFQLVEEWMNEVIRNRPEDNTLQMQLAEFREIQGRIDEAIDIYRQVLDQSSTDERQKATANNNLAFALALRNAPGDLAEAEKMLELSIAFLGPIATLLDTQGVVLMAKGDTSAAIEKFTAAVADMPLGPIYFHLAQAQEKAGNPTRAREAFTKAMELKLDLPQLQVAEAAEFRRLKAEFADKEK